MLYAYFFLYYSFQCLILVHQIHYLYNRSQSYCTNGTYNHICYRKLIDKVDYAELLLYQLDQIAHHNIIY